MHFKEPNLIPSLITSLFLPSFFQQMWQIIFLPGPNHTCWEYNVQFIYSKIMFILRFTIPGRTKQQPKKDKQQITVKCWILLFQTYNSNASFQPTLLARSQDSMNIYTKFIILTKVLVFHTQ